MEKSILDIMINKNEFPIIFIGSGIPRRYLVKYPGWEELLEEFWKKSDQTNFYGYLSKKRDEIGNFSSKVDQDFETNINVASEIEKIFNSKFYDGDIEIGGLTQKEAYKNDLSPFKKALANRFLKYQVKDSYIDELAHFRKMLMKSQMILTTNYDSFIEDQYNKESRYPIKKYVGQRGFFQQTIGYSEIYKIHGCVSEPKSLIISKDDYKLYDDNSVLISAKIISMLLHSPIIFLGYSLTDRNVRKLIKSFTMSLSEQEKEELEKRLLLVQWDKDNNNIIEHIENDPDLGCRITVIKTDNFSFIYDQIAKIDQGIAPSEVRRYQSVIKKLIIEKGRTGSLQSVLISPNELDEIEKKLGNSNIVVAIGDSKLIFNMPNIVDYILDYVQEDTEQNLDTILRFIASQNNNSILPFRRYLSEESILKSSLTESEKEKLRKRLSKFSSKEQQINSLQYNEKYDSLEVIKNKHLKAYQEYSIIAANIGTIGIDKCREYIITELKKIKEEGVIKVPTGLRRLALIYDFTKNV